MRMDRQSYERDENASNVGRNPPISGEIRLIENKDYNERITFQNERL
jgi:hypothetical protein